MKINQALVVTAISVLAGTLVFTSPNQAGLLYSINEGNEAIA